MSLSTLRKMTDEMDALSVEPTMIQGTRIRWPGGSAMAQKFSLPSSIIYYIAMNPSNPKVYNKLIQTCKYFFQRNPILVAANVTSGVICLNDDCIGMCCVEMDIKKFTSKIWLTRRLSLYNDTIPTFVELLRPKVYRCDIVYLRIDEETVEFEDFKFFASSVKGISLDEAQIVNTNGSPVMLETILEELPNVESIFCYFKKNDFMVSAATAKNISKLKNLGNLKKLDLWNIPENFQLDGLFTFFTDHTGIKFKLVFADNISDHYKIQLDQLFDTLIDSQLSNCYIQYDGQNPEKRRILWEISRKAANGNFEVRQLI